jgi:hypothetical protein
LDLCRAGQWQEAHRYPKELPDEAKLNPKVRESKVHLILWLTSYVSRAFYLHSVCDCKLFHFPFIFPCGWQALLQKNECKSFYVYAQVGFEVRKIEVTNQMLFFFLSYQARRLKKGNQMKFFNKIMLTSQSCCGIWSWRQILSWHCTDKFKTWLFLILPLEMQISMQLTLWGSKRYFQSSICCF